MPERSDRGRSPRVVSGSISALFLLDEEVLVQVLAAAQRAGTLALLATSSRQLCRVARSRVPVRLRVTREEHAALLIKCRVLGLPPFSACTQLCVVAKGMACCLLVGGFLSATQPWTALEEVHVDLIHMIQGRCNSYVSTDVCTAGALATLPALQGLRRLQLDGPTPGPCTAALISGVSQVTYLRIGASPTYDDAAADLTALAGMTNLVQLVLRSAPLVQPAAGDGGPFCFPTSLTSLCLDTVELYHANPMGCWLTHLPGCPYLQHLVLAYGLEQHFTAHPSAVVQMLAQHNQQLRTLKFQFEETDRAPGAGMLPNIQWWHPVAGLPMAVPHAEPITLEWRPDEALAALSGLEELHTGFTLSIRDQAHWQRLKQLSALTRLGEVGIYQVPAQPIGTSLVHLQDCYVHMGGLDLGRLLLACPALRHASLWLGGDVVLAPVQQPAARTLAAHPTLQTFKVGNCHRWGSAAVAAAGVVAGAPALREAVMAASAAAKGGAAACQFAALAPVLGHVSGLEVHGWPRGSTGAVGAGYLPDLSGCVAVTALGFSCRYAGEGNLSGWEQEEVLHMLAPLAAMQQLRLRELPRVTARVVVSLQHMSPQLHKVALFDCGTLLPAAAGSPKPQWYEWERQALQQQEQKQSEERALARLRQLLRPGLLVEVHAADDHDEHFEVHGRDFSPASMYDD